MNKRLRPTAAFYAIILCLGMDMVNCNRHPANFKNEETPTSGTIKIAVDESYKLLLDTELYTFLSIYSYAHISAVYKPETEILKDFLADSVRLIITSRNLTDNEDQYLRSKHLVPRTTTVAYDALAFIVSQDNPDSLIRYNDIKGIFTGSIKNWNDLNHKSPSTPVKVVFDNINSGNVRYFVEKFNLPHKLPGNFYATNSNEEVVNYVEKHRNAIGIISVNWISDKNDSLSNSFLKRIRVVAITSEFNSEGDDFYRPYQAYIADKSYPFIRNVYVISREIFVGLGSGFTNFIAGETGQRIILKSKLVPATMPIRFVHLKKNSVE